MRKPSPATIIALLALFVALGGVGVAATGGNFILGNPNSATSVTGLTSNNAGKALSITQQSTGAGATALGLTVPAGKPPLTVSSATKVANLNADQFDGRDSAYFLPKTAKAADSDKLDGIDSTGFLRNLVPLTLTGSDPQGTVQATNTGGGNGVQGLTGATGASGVYGQNDGVGYGVAGRANATGGVGVYAEATGQDGFALQLHTNGSAPPMLVDSSARVDNLNADKVDGASILSNRIISTTQDDHILQMPGFGDVNVVSCDHTNAVFQWSSGGPNAYVTWYDVFNPGDSTQGVFNIVTSNSRPRHFATVQLARNTGGNTSIATVTVTTNGADCVFAAQAVVQPG